MSKIVPNHKSDLETSEQLHFLSNEEITPYVYELLEWLQDLNWPVADPVSKRLLQLNLELVEPLLLILSSDDDVWKYWIVSSFLHYVDISVYDRLIFKLNKMKISPTKQEIEEEVYDAVCVLIESRSITRR
ncbi:TPA: DUF5071 domain-containing protein [Vibrio parahaemolyticus]|uniref:DUF5071 domain-containing protein n=1 Tax=Vibrio parahaemolyticus TaxID=670 RepID=UPI003296C51A|nr:DUF5071 domain-containing protein [Vibrio parahaemolyticus]HCE4652584.1 DUF5071 domain-containing protein [Vibrio parahaemolyticus]HCG8289467.1 DUF5071 domain-containing protein [Vibrio parahaemolyticus]HCG8294875.1 DUF5071 domain-containing protein [Vibrio parahaemolyticus]HCG8300255.1 DUF5071 domain-containing protein [Vibrio parahaemolyticus]